jgi:GNAT superfamily N-acetyltransferase
VSDLLPIPVSISKLDEVRFGVRSARALSLTMDLLPQVMEFCRSERVCFLIARCSTNELATAQSMEDLGFSLMDTLVYYRCDLVKKSLPDRNSVLTRLFVPADVENVRQIAREAFQDYHGHYHADPRLDRAACDDVYVDWAMRSCSQKDMADLVLAAEINGKVEGFLTIKILPNREADGRLFAVSPRAQGQGIGQALLVDGLYRCREQELRGMVISTQITNLVSQRTMVQIGFAPYQSFYTFHKWFD